MLHHCAVITCAATLSLSSVEAATMPDLFAPPQPDVAISVRQWPSDGDPAALRALLVAARERRDLDSIVAAVPRAGRCAAVLAEWDDLHGRPDALDRLVETWWHDGGDERIAPGPPLLWRFINKNPAILAAHRALRLDDHAIACWVQRPTPARWQRLRTWLAEDCPRDAAATNPRLRLHFCCGTTWSASPYDSDQYGMTDQGGRVPLAWLALGDTRPAATAAAQVLARPGERTDDWRWCDVALAQLRLDTDWCSFFHQMIMGIFSREPQGLLTLTQRDATIAHLRTLLAPYARYQLDVQHLEVPPDLAACTTAEPFRLGFSNDENTACTAIWNEAVALGMPEVVGATVLNGPYRVGNKHGRMGVHLHLADGSWLLNGGEHLPPDAVTSEGMILPRAPIGPGIGTNRTTDATSSLALVPQMRLLNNDCPDATLLSALAWWRSGQDQNGQSLVFELLTQAETRIGLQAPLKLREYTQTQDFPDLDPALPDLMRQACAQLFGEWAINAASAATAERWNAAMTAIAPKAEREAWTALGQGLLARQSIPAKAPANADLATRLQSWANEERCPATRADTAALIALLDDARWTRRLDWGSTPRTVGDNALRALNTVWDWDWRLVACRNPAAARLLGAQPADWANGGVATWRPWSEEMRHAVAASLRDWWHEHVNDAELGVSLAVTSLPWIGVHRWHRTLCPFIGDAHLVSACLDTLRRLPPPINDNHNVASCLDDWAFLAVFHPADTRFDAILTHWPDAPMVREFRALRTALAYGDVGRDAWFDAAFAGNAPPFGKWWDDNRCHPCINLGLLTDHPTVARRDRLVALVQRDLNDPVHGWLWPQLGLPCFTSLEHDDRPSDRTPQAYMAIPAAMLLTALTDQRPLPPAWFAHNPMDEREDNALRKKLQHRDHPRLCDWAAAQFILKIGYGWPIDRLPNDVDHNAQDFIFRPVAERDRMIAKLIELVSDLAQETAEKAGLIATPGQDAGNRF